MNINLFQSLYDLINTYIFGGLATDGNYYDLVCIIASTFFNVMLVALPFLVIWKVIRIIFR